MILRTAVTMAFVLTTLLPIVWTLHVHPRHCGGTVHHVHLAVGPTSNSMTVSFATIRCRYEAPYTGVLWGTSPSRLTQLTIEDTRNSPTFYNLTVPKGMENEKEKGVFYSPFYHHVTIYDLEPETVYYYKPVAFHHFEDLEDLSANMIHPPPDAEIPWTPPVEEDVEEEVAKEKRTEPKPEIDLLARDGSRLLYEHRYLVNWPPYDGHERPCPMDTKIRSFRTAPAPGPDASLRLAMIGDLGQFPHSEETLQHLLTRSGSSTLRVDHLILAGDIAYTQEDHRRWDTFFDFMDDYPIADHVPMQVCPGNHDIDKLEHNTEIFLGYEHRFRMPRVHPPVLGVYDEKPGKLNMDAPPYPLPYDWGNAYYSYSSGPAHIIMISAYASMEPGSAQYNWIVSELESVDRSVTPWLICVIHTPMYNTFGLHRHDLQIVAARQNLEPLFCQHRVNFVFSGHIHAYCRTHAVKDDVVDPTGPVHVTIGAGGRKAEAPFMHAEPEDWVAVRDATVYGYGVLHLHNATTATWDWIHTGKHTTPEEPDRRTWNEVYHSNETLPAGPGRDQVVYTNQFYL